LFFGVIVAAAILTCAVIVLASLLGVSNRPNFEPKFEYAPVATDDAILNCTGNPYATTGASATPTNKCIFSGAAPHHVTEYYVRQLCKSRPDCGGYVVRYDAPAKPCDCKADNPTGVCVGCSMTGANSGRPWYELITVDAANHTLPVSPDARGSHGSISTVTHVRV
jgi:hypothetical protein